jgi:hypothetical protein
VVTACCSTQLRGADSHGPRDTSTGIDMSHDVPRQCSTDTGTVVRARGPRPCPVSPRAARPVSTQMFHDMFRQRRQVTPVHAARYAREDSAAISHRGGPKGLRKKGYAGADAVIDIEQNRWPMRRRHVSATSGMQRCASGGASSGATRGNLSRASGGIRHPCSQQPDF